MAATERWEYCHMFQDYRPVIDTGYVHVCYYSVNRKLKNEDMVLGEYETCSVSMDDIFWPRLARLGADGWEAISLERTAGDDPELMLWEAFLKRRLAK